MSHARRLSTTVAALVGAAIAPAAPAAGQPVALDPPHLAATVLFNLTPPGRIDTGRFGTTVLADPSFGVVSFTADGTPSPRLEANAEVGPSTIASIFGRAGGSLQYGLAVVGPDGQVPVLIGASGAVSALATNGASFAVEARWSLLDAAGTPVVGDDIRSGQLTGTFRQSFAHTVGATLTANRPYTIFMLADAGGAATLAGSRVSAHAVIDPIFSFGPGVDPLDYSFVLSAGIGNVRADVVPEPETFALVGLGLLTLGSARARRGARASA